MKREGGGGEKHKTLQQKESGVFFWRRNSDVLIFERIN